MSVIYVPQSSSCSIFQLDAQILHSAALSKLLADDNADDADAQEHDAMLIKISILFIFDVIHGIKIRKTRQVR